MDSSWSLMFQSLKVIKKYILTLNFLNKNSKQLQNKSIYKANINLQSQAIHVDTKNSKNNLHILEGGASGDIEQVIV